MSWESVKCPRCGWRNEGVDLDETDGWVECCNCRTDFRVRREAERFKAPQTALPTQKRQTPKCGAF